MSTMEPAAVLRTETTSAKPADPQPSAKRLVSLDAFRGATIALMVIVNSPGDGSHAYGPLNHSAWNGWTITDVVFPSFLWIVGVAMTLSLGKRWQPEFRSRSCYAQVLRRALILYVLGLVLYGFPRFDLSTLRLMGVLQRIAICYAIAAAIYLTTSLRGQIVWIASTADVVLADHDADPGARLWRGTPGRGAQPGALRRSDRAGRPQLRQHEDLGSGGHHQHPAGHRDGPVRHHGRALSCASARSWRSAPRGCWWRAIC